MDLMNMLRYQMMGQSGGYRPTNELSPIMMDQPSMLGGRLGFETPYRLRGGANTAFVQLPDGSIMRSPLSYDLGIARRMLGGDVDFGLQYGPQDNAPDQYRAMLQYRRQF
jgi:hypothetical protein